MSFLVSFNGQYSPYVYKTPPSHELRVGNVKGVHDFEAELKTSAESISEDGIAPKYVRGVTAYAQQVKAFEQKRLRLHARDIMSAPLHTIQKTDSTARALEVMQRMGFRQLPVLAGEETLAGLISERDILCGPGKVLVSEAMKPQTIVALESARIQDVAHLMLDEKINALPVVNVQHKLLGIITLSDILKFVVHLDEFRV